LPIADIGVADVAGQVEAWQGGFQGEGRVVDREQHVLGVHSAEAREQCRLMRALRLAVLCCGTLLAGCHGSTLDAIYPGSFGHTPPPAINLPAADCPPTTDEWNTCGA